MMTGIRYFATRVLLFCTRPALRYSCEHGEIFFIISRVPQFHRGPADRPVALHGDADRHEDGASQADGGQRVQEPNLSYNLELVRYS